MKIKYLKINNFGKIENKEINFNNNINLIYGKNEAGKSTILKFIYSIFYGASKNKNGKEISDYEKYKPWNNGEYSGKLKYILDNENEIEVFRDFSKKNPKVYNESMEDISKDFNIDKNRGNEFFYEQTGIDENLFLATSVAEQNEVTLNENSQKILTQKIANILSTGDDNISFKKSIDKLNKRLISEIGTTRTVGRPINNILEEIRQINLEKNNIAYEESQEKSIKEEREQLLLNLSNIENEINLLKNIKEIKEQEVLEEEKAKINKDLLENYNEKINKLNKSRKKRKSIAYLLLLIPINIVVYFLKIKVFSIFLGIISLIITLITLYINKKKLDDDKILQKEIKMVEKNRNDLNEKNEQEFSTNNDNKEKKIIELKLQYKNRIQENIIEEYLKNNIKEINEYISKLEDENNKINLSLHKLEFDENNMKKELDKKIELDEKLEYLNEQKTELEKLEKAILLSKEVLEQSYEKMKSDITPQFTQKLSLIAEKISNGKYKNVIFNDEKGMLVELDNGEYIDTNYLSLGTIDQLYLSLRLSTISKISKEKLPIILDEAFAYYDDERIENIIKYLNEQYGEYQIILFTCSEREKKILDKLNIKYNLVEI